MKNWNKVFWGIILIAVGVVFLGNNLDWWHINIFFKGWWSLFIIIPSIYGLFEKGSFTGSLISLSVGILLLLSCQDVIAWSMIWKILVPIIIIIIGLRLIITPKPNKKIDKTNSKSYVAVFSGVEEKISKIESDFSATSVFGGVDLDLRKAKIEKDIVIECTTVFGGIDLKLPDNVNLKINGLPMFGGIDNRYDETQDGKITIYINYTCIFGGIDII